MRDGEQVAAFLDAIAERTDRVDILVNNAGGQFAAGLEQTSLKGLRAVHRLNVDATWDVSLVEFGRIVLANVLGMLMGFMLAVVLRSTPAALVGYLVYSFVLPIAFGTLAAFQGWFADLQPWVDVQYAITGLFSDVVTAEHWQQLGVTTLVWLWIPLAFGLRAVLRAEVK